MRVGRPVGVESAARPAAMLPPLLFALLAAAASHPLANDAASLQIVGGETADIKTVPYQVSIEFQKAHRCGGSVLSATWILTAAHCVYGTVVGALQVRAGTDKLQTGGTVHPVKAAVAHPSYVSGRSDWDVAVVQLASALALGATVKAVPLPASGREPQTNIPVLASGWGLTSAQKGNKRSGVAGANADLVGLTEISPRNPAAAVLPTQLRKVTVRVVGRQACTASYKTTLTARMICAAAPGKDTCTYDSGGPLVDPQGVQVGVVSWGNGCADPSYPGVYAHLGNADIRSFIKKHTGL